MPSSFQLTTANTTNFRRQEFLLISYAAFVFSYYQGRMSNKIHWITDNNHCYSHTSHDSSLFVNLVLHLNCQGAHTQVKASSVAGWHQPGKLNMDDVIWSGYRPLDAINDLDMYRFLQYFGKPILQRENIKN